MKKITVSVIVNCEKPCTRLGNDFVRGDIDRALLCMECIAGDVLDAIDNPTGVIESVIADGKVVTNGDDDG